MIRWFNISIAFFILQYSNGQYLPNFSAFMETDILYNPSVSGNKDYLSSTMGYRYQWVGVNGCPKYYILSTNIPLKNKKNGLAVNFLNESIGPNRNNILTGNYSYRLLLANGVMSMGLSAGFKNSNYNASMVNVSDPSDPVFNGANRSEFLPYFGFGLSYNYKDFVLGLALADLTNKSFTDDFTFTMKYNYQLNKELLLKYYVFYKYGPSKLNQMEMGFSLEHKKRAGFYLGFRTNQDILFGLRLNVSKKLFLFYCYDYITRYNNGFTNSSHELILRYDLIEERKANNPRDF